MHPFTVTEAQLAKLHEIARGRNVESITFFGGTRRGTVEYRVNSTNGTFGSHVVIDAQGKVL